MVPFLVPKAPSAHRDAFASLLANHDLHHILVSIHILKLEALFDFVRNLSRPLACVVRVVRRTSELFPQNLLHNGLHFRLTEVTHLPVKQRVERERQEGESQKKESCPSPSVPW